MISVKTKAESVASSPLGLSSVKDEAPTLSFSELLRGAKDTKDEKGVQNGSFILSLGAEEKELKPIVNTKEIKAESSKDTLSSLLKNTDKAVKEEIEPLALNPKVTETLTVAEVKVLIADAKKFLKDQILDSTEYKKAQLKELPKTLKGLAQMAKDFGIDVSKITLEEVRSTAKPVTLKEDTKVIAQDIKQTKEVAQTKQVEKAVPAKQVQDVKTDTLDIKEEKPVSQTKETSKVEADVEDVVDVKVKTPKIKTAKGQVEQDVVQEVKHKEVSSKEEVKENIRVDDKKIETLKDLKSTPLFKAQEKVEHTTEQLVQTKQFKVEEKTPKTRADETLKLLLRGEKPSSENANVGMTKDFSVATARVIAPSATTEVSKSFEQLLRGDVAEEIVKPDSAKTQDVDSFDAKVKEAKQMVKYLSQDVKNAIEDYKSPFTRIKVQLNPQKMGEVDLTVVQRGKNLHVNLTSNNAAINTLAMNANDLKAQLNNNGIQNATLNFSDSSQNSEQQNSQQRNRQNERKADEEYNYFDNEEQNEEVLNSLEIVVPNYA